jgi:hypothetical protein
MVRKIQRVALVIDVEAEGRTGMPTRKEIADGLIEAVGGDLFDVTRGRDLLDQRVVQLRIIGVYSNVATREEDRRAPSLEKLRQTPAAD